MKKNKKIINYGKLLAKAIKSKGLIKSKVAENLFMSRPTLNIRLVDGEFTQSELEIVKEIIK